MKEYLQPFDEDFGFSFVDEDFEEVKSQVSKLETATKSDKETIEDLEKRLQAMFNSIDPFLENLKKNPEKTTIYWPNRTEKISQFQQRLKQILVG
jgi:chromosome segregation ATPase